MEMRNESKSTSEATELRSTAVEAVTRNAIGLGPGTVLSGRFEIGVLLGDGGMGSVYAARDRVTGRDIAIKVLLPELIASQHARDRFMAEAIVCCDLSHPNIVRVYDVGVSGPHLYFSMERLRGQTLRQRLRAHQHQRMPLAAVSSIARQMIEALQYVQRSIVHRDIKPENTWLNEDGTVKLMDFGIARDLASSDLTKTGMALGTPSYMAPEQLVSAKHVDWRADQYSLGVVLYEMLTGSLPMGVIRPLQAVRRDLPKRYARAVMRALSAQPEDRWPSWVALLAELAVPQRTPMRPAAVVGVGVAVVAIAAVGLYLKGREPVVAGTDSAATGMRQGHVKETAGTAEEEKPDADRAAERPAVPAPPEVKSAAVEPARIEESDSAPTRSKSALVAGTVPPLSLFRDRLQNGSRGPVMVVIPAGEFLMGSPASEAGRENAEGPQRRVTIRRFALAQLEVTFDEFDRFVDAPPGRKRPDDGGWGRGTRPVINVSWNDATAYAEWLSQQTREEYRLPTEAEWEYAARAGTTTPFSTGKCLSATQANFNDRIEYAYAGCPASNQYLEKTQPVGVFPANPFGLRDLHGNVWELVEDCYHENYSGAPVDGRAWLEQDKGDCGRRVLRGGSWVNYPRNLRSAYRNWNTDDVANVYVGFRLARTL